MAENWPATLPDRPLKNGYIRNAIDNTIRTNMSYGPPKIRRRVTSYLYNVNMKFLFDRLQYETLYTFYTAEAANEFIWKDHGLPAEPGAFYIFLSPPTMRTISGVYFDVGLNLLMESITT